MTTAFFSGSFDPMTNGHLSILRQALAAFDRVVVGIGTHASKKAMFSFEARAEMIRACLPAGDARSAIDVVAFDNLVVEAAEAAGASVIVRGLRDATDFDYEMQMAGMNARMRPAITTVFLPASPDTRPITATLVRQIARMGGDVSPFVPGPVLEALRQRRT